VAGFNNREEGSRAVSRTPNHQALNRCHNQVPVKVEETKLGTSTQVHARAAGCVGGEFMSSDWHRDECTFVCVIMLSDVPEEKRGAETILKKADESEESLLFPVGSKGHAYMLHGSHIQHRFCPVEFDCVYITIRLQPADGWGSMDEEPSIVSDDGDDQVRHPAHPAG